MADEFTFNRPDGSQIVWDQYTGEYVRLTPIPDGFLEQQAAKRAANREHGRVIGDQEHMEEMFTLPASVVFDMIPPEAWDDPEELYRQAKKLADQMPAFYAHDNTKRWG